MDYCLLEKKNFFPGRVKLGADFFFFKVFSDQEREQLFQGCYSQIEVSRYDFIVCIGVTQFNIFQYWKFNRICFCKLYFTYWFIQFYFVVSMGDWQHNYIRFYCTISFLRSRRLVTFLSFLVAGLIFPNIWEYRSV